VFGLVFYEAFREFRFLIDLVKGNSAMGLCAVGMTFVILSGGIDLSVGSVLALTSVIVATMVAGGSNPVVAFAAAVLVATVLGIASGVLIHRFVLPPFLVTLAGMFFARGLAFYINMDPTTIDHPTFDAIGDDLGFMMVFPGWGQAWVPPNATMFVIVLALGIVLARWTRFGRNVYAIGGDSQAAVLMGVPIGVTTMGLYAFSGACAGFGGLATTLIDSAGKPNIGIGLELEAIAAVVIGGTRLSGGVGTVAGTLMGVLIIGLIRAVVNLDGRLPSPWHHITIGLLLMAFIVMQQLLARRSPKAH
jgi:simple sugar transport system permease protein